MVTVTITSPVPVTLPADGWRVEYRIKGSVGAYTTPVGSPYTALPIEFTTADPAGTLYEVRMWRDCGDLESSKHTEFTPCTCTTAGYTPNVSGTGCEKVESIPAIVTNSEYCLAPSTNGAYSNFPARIYNIGVTQPTIMFPPGTSHPEIHGELSTTPQWSNPTLSPTIGPMNREGVWIDNNCDGNKDSLTVTTGALTVGAKYTILTYFAGDDFTNIGAGSNANGVTFVATGSVPAVWTNGTILSVYETTIAFTYNNLGLSRTVFVGIGGDNQFKLVHNGVVIIDTGAGTPGNVQFKIWHLIPVVINTGLNYFNAVALGDGSVDDSLAMVVYDNSIAQLTAAVSDATLTILFKSSSLRGTTYDVATCPATYSLDTSGGVGDYVCVKTLTKVCNTAV